MEYTKNDIGWNINKYKNNDYISLWLREQSEPIPGYQDTMLKYFGQRKYKFNLLRFGYLLSYIQKIRQGWDLKFTVESSFTLNIHRTEMSGINGSIEINPGEGWEIFPYIPAIYSKLRGKFLNGLLKYELALLYYISERQNISFNIGWANLILVKSNRLDFYGQHPIYWENPYQKESFTCWGCSPTPYIEGYFRLNLYSNIYQRIQPGISYTYKF